MAAFCILGVTMGAGIEPEALRDVSALPLAFAGLLLVVAAVRTDPDAAGGLDGAVHALLALPSGPWLAGIVGAGLIAYGLFCFFRARYARF